jgi:hypothetical protein
VAGFVSEVPDAWNHNWVLTRTLDPIRNPGYEIAISGVSGLLPTNMDEFLTGISVWDIPFGRIVKGYATADVALSPACHSTRRCHSICTQCALLNDCGLTKIVKLGKYKRNLYIWE